MAQLRFEALKKLSERVPVTVEQPTETVSKYFGQNVYGFEQMRATLAPGLFKRVSSAIKNHEKIDETTADAVASAAKSWAMAKGATHFTHWFQPMTGGTAEKHDSFFDALAGIEKFKGSELVQQEPDASSFPSGGIRSTFEARGYTAWDPTSPMFLYGKTLCIPTVFVSYTGETLDTKAPLLKALKAVDIAATQVCQLFDKDIQHVTASLGSEQEYFVVDKALYQARPDLVMAGRTVFGHAPARGQQLEDHYFGSIPARVYEFMKDFEIEAWKLGIPVRTRHNEVAPSQFEVAPLFEEVNVANDHNQLMMDVMDRVASKHELKVLFHEKPFAGLNGTGKHNNWSLITDTGVNLYAPTSSARDNLLFLTFFVTTIKAVHAYSDLLRASIDTGKLLATDTIYPHEPRRDWDGSLAKLARIAAQTQAELISIGNGTASRETDKLASELIARHPEFKLQKIVVSEAGASVYSASELAAKEFPDLDVSLRGAVSIARRLQDPLAELVKIEPKAIGVGQYQHDVNQRELARSLDAVVEDCVNAVGVDANTASIALLARVSGLNSTLARNIVEYRDANGPFPSREHLRKVPRLGDKTFEQAAGFLRINGGENPLDRSSVHPEAYPVVQRILAKISKQIDDVLGNRAALNGLSPAEFVDDRFGLPTVRDILAELEKPGRDPRPEFKTATFREGVEKLSDLAPGMVLEGVVTNVAAFGAFVDIGVHQDGLVHVSAMSTKFIKDPHEVVKAGQVVKVKVLDVDVKRQRIALTMRLADDAAPPSRDERGANRTGGAASRAPQRTREPEAAGAMAAAFAKLKQR